MTFISNSPRELDSMLKTIGIKNLEDLFEAVPEKYRFPDLNLPPAITEMEAAVELGELAAGNESTRDLVSFLGAGMYNHYIPSAVNHILLRGEYYTAYTPYQPEISQGTLQAIFEYQSLLSNLTGMEVSNASHYDGATAAAEAANMAWAVFRGKRTKIVVSPTVHPQYREVIHTYTQGMDLEHAGDDPNADLEPTPEAFAEMIDDNTMLVIVQYPDFFGRIYDYTKLIDKAHEKGALVCVVANPTMLAMFKTPADMGADIVVGEGQPLGIPMWYGGPSLGFFTTTKKFVHKMAGRLVGETIDNRGQKAYVLTLTAREQHIKRQRASSNICTNQSLLALASAVYLSLVGKHGLRQVAELCYHKAHYAAKQLSKLPGIKLGFSDPFFHEFTLNVGRPVDEVNAHLLEHGILGGYDLGQDYPALKQHLLVAVTEMNSKEEIDLFVQVLAEVSHE
ncbi:MAG: aminomethyl-transferring glycine dehydrogenase subunit GcvPA [Anaerolineae bacterium]|nr:aminomethyl-transferring glycine dehydrogenase subunit GcvPA [Anaerolineae bacterium]